MLCNRKGVNIIEGEVCPDHIHLLQTTGLAGGCDY